MQAIHPLLDFSSCHGTYYRSWKNFVWDKGLNKSKHAPFVKRIPLLLINGFDNVFEPTMIL